MLMCYSAAAAAAAANVMLLQARLLLLVLLLLLRFLMLPFCRALSTCTRTRWCMVT